MSDFFNLNDVYEYIEQYETTTAEKITYDSILMDCISHIVEKLKNNELLGLELNETLLTSEHIALLVVGLKANQSLQFLCLSINSKVGGNDVAKIFDAINNHPNLLILEMAELNFAIQSYNSLGNFIKNNKTILYLDISKNTLDDASIAMLAHSLAINQSLLGLKFVTNYQLENFVNITTLLDSLKQNKKLAFLEIGKLFSANKDAINATLKLNRVQAQCSQVISKELVDYIQVAREKGWQSALKCNQEIALFEILKMVGKKIEEQQLQPVLALESESGVLRFSTTNIDDTTDLQHDLVVNHESQKLQKVTMQ